MGTEDKETNVGDGVVGRGDGGSGPGDGVLTDYILMEMN